RRADGSAFSGGTVLKPDEGEVCRCKMELRDGGTRVKVSGCTACVCTSQGCERHWPPGPSGAAARACWASVFPGPGRRARPGRMPAACDKRRLSAAVPAMPRPALVTNALPYANGPLHSGHLVGYVQADIWVRARRMAGGTVHYVCADDTHGTPIMLAAEKAGTPPAAFLAGIQAGHERDFADFAVEFDNYDSTNSERNRALTGELYRRLDAAGHISRRSVRA